MTRSLLLVFLVGLPARAGRLDLPEGGWTNGQRPGFQVTVGDAKGKRMTWDVDGLVLKGTYRVVSAPGPKQVLFYVDSMTADGTNVRSSSIGKVPVEAGGQVRSLWVWREKGFILTVQGKGGEQLTVLLPKSVPRR